MEGDKIQQARRLKWLCGEMLRRQEEDKDTRRFGCSIFGVQLVTEATTLAKSLGFSVPPVEYTDVEINENDRRASVPPPPPFNWDGPGRLRTLFVCQTHDPFGSSGQHVLTGSIVDISVGGKPFSYDIYEAMDRSDIRAAAAKHLAQWQRAAEGIIEGTPQSLQLASTNIFHGANIAAMHTGLGSIHDVQQNINPKLGDILKAIEQSKSLAAELQATKKEELIEALDNLKDEIELANPKQSKVKLIAKVVLGLAVGIGSFTSFAANISTVLQGAGVPPQEIQRLLSHFPH
jgi:hypothetical protein